MLIPKSESPDFKISISPLRLSSCIAYISAHAPALPSTAFVSSSKRFPVPDASDCSPLNKTPACSPVMLNCFFMSWANFFCDVAASNSFAIFLRLIPSLDMLVPLPASDALTTAPKDSTESVVAASIALADERSVSLNIVESVSSTFCVEAPESDLFMSPNMSPRLLIFPAAS